MKKAIFILPLFLIFFTCAKFPILSDLVNNRIHVILKGTYESNTPYGWEPNVFMDDTLAAYTGAINTADAQSSVSMYIDISEIRLGTGKTGKPDNVTPDKYWIYFTPNREVFCSDNYANGNLNYKLLSCYNDHGDKNYAELFSSGFTYPAFDVPENTYNHLAIFFRKFIVGPSISYSDTASNTPVNQTATFDNRFINGINLMDSIIQYAASDTSKLKPLMFPLERTDLSLKIPSGRDPYVLEVRIFLKNLLMKHVIAHLGGNSTAGPTTFIGPSDWSVNHNSADLNLAYQMGGNVIFTARIYDPANVGSIAITDTEALPACKSYYAVVPSGSTFTGADLPYAATSRSGLTTLNAAGTISNLPPGNYDIYKTADRNLLTAAGLALGKDGYPEKVSNKCTTVTVTAGASISTDISGCITL